MLALNELAFKSKSVTVVVSPSQRQSSEVQRRIATFYNSLPALPKLTVESATRLETETGLSCDQPAGLGRQYQGNFGLHSSHFGRGCSYSATDRRQRWANAQAVVSNHARCIAMSTQNIWQPLNWFSDMWSRGIG